MSSSFRSVAGQDGAGDDGGGEELEGGAISGRGRIENGGVTMMPGADGAVSVAGVAPGSVSAQRRSTEKKQPSATAATTVNSLFIQSISLRAVSLYSDPTGAAWELPYRVARLTQKDVFCLAPLAPAVCGRREKDLWTARQASQRLALSLIRFESSGAASVSSWVSEMATTPSCARSV
jgi:hypothetical protein